MQLKKLKQVRTCILVREYVADQGYGYGLDTLVRVVRCAVAEQGYITC